MGRLKLLPIVTILVAVIFVAAPYVIDPARGAGERFDRAIANARAQLHRNPNLQVDAEGEQLLDPAWLAELRAVAEETQAGAEVELPARMVARSQSELDGHLAEAFEARRLAEPAWRLGVLDGETPRRNYWVHAFVRDDWAGAALFLAVLLFVAAPLERSWGSLLFGAFVLLAIPISAQGYRLLDASSGVPWHGPSGLAAAIVGAYFIRGLGGHFIVPGPIVLPVWFALETFVVRGFWLDDLGSVPWATLFGAIAMGAAQSAVLRALGIEAKLDAVTGKGASNGPNPVVIRAARLKTDGDPNQAFELIAAAWRENRDDEEIAEFFHAIAVELGRPEEAAEAILPVLRGALKKGQIERALGYWLPLAQRRCEVRLEPTASVRLGEALLDAGHPEEALFSLRSALDAGASTAHALRILNVARDLDPGLTRRAASIALSDAALDSVTRERLEPLATPLVEPTQFPNEAPAGASADLISHWNDRGALAAGALEGDAPEDVGSAGVAGAEPPGSTDLLETRGLLFGDEDLDYLDADLDAESDTTDGDRTPVLDALSDEATSPMGQSARPSAADADPDSDATVMMPSPAAVAPGVGKASPERALLRELRVIDAVPIALLGDAVEIEADGRGKSRLPFARIEAIALAAVRGLGPRPVVVLDCALNWRDDIGSPLKLIRFRSDRIEPAALGCEDAGESPVKALSAFAARLHAASRAACLPSETALAGSFASFGSLENYEREVLGAERALGA